MIPRSGASRASGITTPREAGTTERLNDPAGRLMAVLRAEFRAELVVFPATDPVFGGGHCRVPATKLSEPDVPSTAVSGQAVLSAVRVALGPPDQARA